MFDYFQKHQNDPNPRNSSQKTWKIPKTINMGMPFSLRQPQEKLTDMKLNNDVVAIPVSIGVFDHFFDSLQETKQKF